MHFMKLYKHHDSTATQLARTWNKITWNNNVFYEITNIIIAQQYNLWKTEWFEATMYFMKLYKHHDSTAMWLARTWNRITWNNNMFCEIMQTWWCSNVTCEQWISLRKWNNLKKHDNLKQQCILWNYINIMTAQQHNLQELEIK